MDKIFVPKVAKNSGEFALLVGRTDLSDIADGWAYEQAGSFRRRPSRCGQVSLDPKTASKIRKTLGLY
jgi:hypothetical protein